MAILRINDIKDLSNKELFNKLEELKKEYIIMDDNPGKRREIKKSIARIYTVLNERELGINKDKIK